MVVDNCSMHNDPQGKGLIEGEYEMFFGNEFVVLRDEVANTLPRVYEAITLGFIIYFGDGRDVRDVTDCHLKQGQTLFFFSLRVHANMQGAIRFTNHPFVEAPIKVAVSFGL